MIPQEAEVRPGELILTSGLGGTYPGNILVGQVSSVRKLQTALFQSASVQPVVDFANLQPGLAALQRSGGNVDLLKRMVSAGFPVLTEKGYYEYDYNGKLGWMGHYQFVTGYDESKKTFLVQDTYLKGPNYKVSYTDFVDGWRAFDRIFMVVYPPDRESQVMQLLGPYADPQWAAAEDKAGQDL